MLTPFLTAALAGSLVSSTPVDLPPPDPEGALVPMSGAMRQADRDNAYEKVPLLPALTRADAFALAFRDTAPSAFHDIGGETFNFKPMELIVLPDRIVLLSEGDAFEARQSGKARPGRVGVHYIERHEGRWVVTGEWLDTISINFIGPTRSGWGVSHDFLSVPTLNASTIRFEDGLCEAMTSTIYAFTADGPRELVRLPMLFDNSSAYKGTDRHRHVLSAIPRAYRNKSFTLRFHGLLMGTRLRREITYDWTGSRFEPQGGAPRLGTCEGKET